MLDGPTQTTAASHCPHSFEKKLAFLGDVMVFAALQAGHLALSPA